MKSRVAAWLMALLLLVYFVLLGWRAVQFILTGDLVGILIGAALIVLPLVGAWALWRELAFGFGTERLVKRLAAEDGLPEEELEVSPSGRPDKEEATADFGRFQAEVEAEPESWRAWFRLGLAYDAARDRRRARGAIVHALKLERAESRAGHAADDAR
ncbi:MAG: hypothetical protein ABWY36_01180 [Leifsonia sp.]